MNRQSVARNTTGIIIAIVGAVLLLNTLHVVAIDNLVTTYWPLGMIAAGVLILINSWRSWPVAAFLLALGGLYQLRVMNVIDVEPWPLVWPLVLIFIGVSVVFGRSYTGKRVSKAERDDVSAILAGASVNNHSKSFKQSNATAIMGGAKIDLRQANFNKQALVDVFAFWGGVEIIVPEHVVIRNQISNIMAGTDDRTHQKTTKDSPVLTVAGTVIMAGVSIRNTPSDS